MKKILYTATVVKTHVMQFHVPYLQMLQAMGWETAVAAKNDYEDPADCVIPGCDKYYDIPFARLPWKSANFRAYRQLRQLIRREKYDVIHCHTPVGAMITRLAAEPARKKGTKVIYTAHGFHFYRGAPALNWMLYYPAEWIFAFLTDVLITINREDYAFALKHLHAKQVVYVPGMGIDTDKFHPAPGIREAKRRELGLGPGDFAVLTVAEMTKNKNYATILRALALMKDAPEFSSLQYLVVGTGEEWEDLKKLTAQLEIEEHVHFLGYRQDVREIYAAADLFVFMSYREGLSVALMEALCSGLCAVCTRIRGNTDLVEDGVTGLFSDNDPQSLCRKILQTLKDPALRSRLGRSAMKSMDRLDAASIHEQVKKIYLDVTGEKA